MEAIAHGNRKTMPLDAEANNVLVRQKVMESYQDMLSGKSRDYKEFFAELESRYKKN